MSDGNQPARQEAPPRPAVFIDRDGTLNAMVYHQEQEVLDSPFSVRQFELLPGAAEAVRLVRQAGFPAVLISNQPGIAKGHFSRPVFNLICRKMRDDLARAGTALDGEYYCLHHPEARLEEYRTVCDCRKPQPGLLLQAARELNLDLARSWMIGDNLSDVQAGQRAGCRTILVCKMKCDVCRLMAERRITPDQICESLLEAVKFILCSG